jgi:RNA recognition motif-containing protein
MNIYVGNLPFSTTQEELSQIFSEYGQVQSAKIIVDRETGKAKGFGFVEMSETAARKAISELNEAEFGGKQLTVNEARPKNDSYGSGRSGGGNRGRSW